MEATMVKEWKHLSKLQLGKYAEYLVKMEFTSYGFEVFSPEVDEHGIDFIVKGKRYPFIEIQVKSTRKSANILAEKKKFDINNKNLFMAVVIFKDGAIPHIYLIPADAWKKGNALLVERNYGKQGQTSKPEYGLNISNKNFEMLKQYEFEKIIQRIL
jgi:hypothetical protein